MCLLQVAWNVILCRIASSSSTPQTQGRLKPEPKSDARDKPLKVRFWLGHPSFSQALYYIQAEKCSSCCLQAEV